MTVNLTSYQTLGHALICRLAIDEYRVLPTDDPISTVLKFSNSPYTITATINGVEESYTGLGNFLNISSSTTELKASGNQVTISLSGIPSSSLYEIMNSKIKGSRIQVWRVIYNPSNQTQSTIVDPVCRFSGIVNNYGLDETFDRDTLTSTNTINLVCSSMIDVLSNTLSGRRTNPTDQQSYYPGDTSFDRVPNLIGAAYNFGALPE